jgi:hypothetical protein
MNVIKGKLNVHRLRRNMHLRKKFLQAGEETYYIMRESLRNIKNSFQKVPLSKCNYQMISN